MKRLWGILGISLIILGSIFAYKAYMEEHPEASPEYLAEMAKITPVPTISVSEEGELPLVVEETEKLWQDEGVKPDAFVTQAVDIPKFEDYDYEYTYELMNKSAREVYDVIYMATILYQEDVELPTLDEQQLSKVYKCMMSDHPEIFYVSGYKFTKYTYGKKIKKLTYTAAYTYPKNERDIIWKKLDEAADAIIAGLPEDADDDYSKIKYIYETVISNTEYDKYAEDNQNIISVLLNHSSVCSGYAKTVQLLLNRLGIDNVLVSGNVSTGEGHAWNLVYSDGDWYYLDATWGDAYNELADSKQIGADSLINYDYMLVTSDEIKVTHSFDRLFKLPSCKATKDNYFIREGLMFEGYDGDRIGSIINEGYAEGREYVTFKCISSEVYDEMVDELMNKQKIFDYLKDNSGNVRYSNNERMRTLTFWL